VLNIQKASFFFLIFFASGSLLSAKCDAGLKPSGFTTVKGSNKDKVHFYKDLRMCEAKPCATMTKAYLLGENFVQTFQQKDGFVCALFRNYDGYGGKKTSGWLSLKDLNPIRQTLERKDLIGSWTYMHCPDGDDCVIDISEENKKLSVYIMSHLHSHPGTLMSITNVKEEVGKLVLVRSVEGVPSLDKIEILYDTLGQEIGTIQLKGEEYFNGVYRK
jgi:hypothetical protein